MDVFAFRDELVSEYERFSRSFTKIRADDIRQAVDAAYAGGRFWPAPLIQLNPNYVAGACIDDLETLPNLSTVPCFPCRNPAILAP